MDLNPIVVADVNIRSGPSEGFDILGHLKAGTQFKVLETKKDQQGRTWYKNDAGWVNSTYTKLKNQISNKPRLMSLDSELNKASDISNVVNKVKTAVSTKINLNSLNKNSSGINDLNTQDIILTRRIIGSPFQFIETTDNRPDRTSGDEKKAPLGLEFTNNILTEMPIISILPGKPSYLIDVEESKRKDIISTALDGINETIKDVKESIEDITDKLASLDETKFFEFESDTSVYFNYVDTMCWVMAAFLGIENRKVPGTDIPYNKYDWFNWRLSNSYANKTINAEGLGDRINGILGNNDNQADGTEVVSNIRQRINSNFGTVTNSSNQIVNYSNSLFTQDFYYIDFFIKPPSFSESFTNDIGDSAISGLADNGSKMAKELAFMATGSGAADAIIEQNTKAFLANAKKEIDGYAGPNDSAMANMLNRIIRGSTTVFTGSNLIFPQIWQDSSYDRGFQVEMTLSTPYGDKESVFLEILVPLAHILALVMPRQTSTNSYTSPFIVRCSCPGYFSCDMGIVKDVQLTKGGSSGESWSIDGLPTEITVSMTIQDLYSTLSMATFSPSSIKSIGEFMKNLSYFDFISILCGLNVKVANWDKRFDVLKNLITNMGKNLKDNLNRNISERVTNGVLAYTSMRKKADE